MAHHIIPESPQFSAEVRKFETTDRNHADVLNRPIAALIENDHFLKSELGKKADKEETNKIYTATELAQKTLQNGQMYFVKVSKGQILEQIGQYSIFKENSGQVTSLKGGSQTDKVYSVYYDSAKNGFFIRASATGTAAADHVLAGKTFSSEADTDLIGTMPNRGTWNATLGTDGQVVIPGGYHSGTGKVNAQMVSGRTIIPGRTEQTAIEAGKLATSDIKISGDSNLHAENIRHGSNIFGTNGNFTADATAESGNILEGRVAYAKGQRIIGTLPWRGNQTQGVMPSRQTQRMDILNGVHQGGGYIEIYGDNDLQPGNIRQGVNIFGVQGTAKTDYSAEQTMIANAITNKGVPTPTNSSWAQMANNIESLPSLQILNITTNSSGEYYLKVNQPFKAILLEWSTFTSENLPDYALTLGYYKTDKPNAERESYINTRYNSTYGKQLSLSVNSDNITIKTSNWSRRGYYESSLGPDSNQPIIIYIYR